MTFDNLPAAERRFSKTSGDSRRSSFVAHRHNSSLARQARRVITCKLTHPQAARPDQHGSVTVNTNIYKPNRPLADIEPAQGAIELIVNRWTSNQ